MLVTKKYYQNSDDYNGDQIFFLYHVQMIDSVKKLEKIK